MTLSPGEQLDSYRIVAALGRGAFSEIYQATDAQGRPIVLKCPYPNLLGDPNLWERFRREMAIAARLRHPNIQRALEVAGERGRPYLVFEYVEGRSFREHLRERGPLPVDDAVQFAMQIARGLAYAHEQHVYHRDLKPENILISSAGELKLVDFGVAFMEGAKRLTWSWLSSAVGTPDYMAPEQIQGKRGDARSDVYGLGVVLFEMLAGRVPWAGDNPLSIMSQQLSTSPPPLHTLNREVPPPVEAIVRKALRKNPRERYQDAGGMLQDLERWHDLDLRQFIFADERLLTPARGERGLWLLMAGVAAGFLLASALVLLVYAALVHR